MSLQPFAVRKQPSSIDIVLLFLRLLCGYAFILHGWGKISNPFHWMGPDAKFPAILQALAAVAEFGGGISLMAGLLTRLGALGIACTMVVAVFIHRMAGHPFVAATLEPAYELASVYLAVSLLFVVMGPGRFSVDRYLFRAKH